MDDRRVVVTGIGMLCALALDREATWLELVAGTCGIRDLTLFSDSGYRSTKVAEIGNYQAGNRFSPHDRRRLSRSDQLALVAAGEAVADAGIIDSGLPPERIGVVLGAGSSDMLRNEVFIAETLTKGLRRARLSKVFNHFTNTPGDAVASRFGFTGLKACPVSACSSSTVAIGLAADAIRYGQIDAALCGGSDILSRLTLSGFNALRLVDTEPCRPFDSSRNGMNIGEAAAILVLEEMERARRRGARIYAEVAGYGVRCEAYHATSPEPGGGAVAATLRAALDASGIDASAVDHVNSHGTATLYNDLAEARGLRAVFGERVRTIPVTSVKSMIGHCLGAAGAIEAAALALTIARGVIPPTIHHTRTDPECDVEVVANEARQAAVRCGISTSLAFGGNDAAIVMRWADDPAA